MNTRPVSADANPLRDKRELTKGVDVAAAGGLSVWPSVQTGRPSANTPHRVEQGDLVGPRHYPDHGDKRIAERQAL